MTPFPGRAGAAAHLKVTRQPPFPHRTGRPGPPAGPDRLRLHPHASHMSHEPRIPHAQEERGGPGARNGSPGGTFRPAPRDWAGAGRVRLAQCEPGAAQSAPPRAVRAQRDGIRLRSILAIPPRTMRARVTSPKPLPRGSAQTTGRDLRRAGITRLPRGRGSDGRRPGSRAASPTPRGGDAQADGSSGVRNDPQ